MNCDVKRGEGEGILWTASHMCAHFCNFHPFWLTEIKLNLFVCIFSELTSLSSAQSPAADASFQEGV